MLSWLLALKRTASPCDLIDGSHRNRSGDSSNNNSSSYSCSGSSTVDINDVE